MSANVTPINPAQVDPILVSVRAFAAARCLHRMIELLEADLKTAKANWTATLTEATQAYRNILRDDHSEKVLSQKRAKELFFECIEGLANRDQIAEKAKADKDERKQRIARIDTAFTEVMGVAADSGNQTDMFGTDSVPGMGWASKDTTVVVYTTLLHLDNTGAKLDEHQSELLADLGAGSLEAIELGLDASEAIVSDVAPADPEDEGSSEEIPDSEVPF